RELTRRFPEIQVVYTSGYTEEAAARRELVEAPTIFLEKPYTVADLAGAVQRGLSLKSAPKVPATNLDAASAAGS
ncbi:MAG TPA: hypothetical protein VE779_10885, partial [Candidatus Angelobacter sp.]|nr:hypothetical protein [Candidatus Angelobacter sp.]